MALGNCSAAVPSKHIGTNRWVVGRKKGERSPKHDRHSDSDAK